MNLFAALLLLVAPTLTVCAPTTTTSSALDIIPNAYIITLKPSSSLSSHLSSLSKRSSTTRVTSEFSLPSFQGYAAQILNKAEVEALRDDPDVLAIEPDRIATIADDYKPSKTLDPRLLVIQSPIPNWGLGRISHVAPGATKYVYDSTAGENTWAYVMDTGVYAQHSQFAPNRASWPGYSSVSGGSTVDQNGHGTHISGIIAGTLSGVAKKANIVPVRVLDASGSGSNSGVVAGINWALQNAVANNRLNKSLLYIGVAGSYSAVINNAVTSAISAGLFVITSAGSSNTNISNTSPASAPGVFVVAASTLTDGNAPYNNYGPLLDLHAPGQSILSTWIGSTTATNTISGGTAAAAHAAGVALYLMRLHATTLTTPAAVASYMTQICTPVSFGCIVYNGSGF